MVEAVKLAHEAFLKTTNILSVKHFYHSKGWLLKVIFFASFLTGVGLFIWQTIGLTRKLYSHPKTASRKLITETAPFPAVTICNLNPIPKSSITKNTELTELLAAFNFITQKKDLIESLEAGRTRKKREADPDIRVTGSPMGRTYFTTPVAGRVELRQSDGSWLPVCDDLFGLEEAKVVCRMLGMWPQPGTYGFLEKAAYGTNGGSFAMDNVVCTGNEDTLYDCNYLDKNSEDCGTFEAVSVGCIPGDPPVTTTTTTTTKKPTTTTTITTTKTTAKTTTTMKPTTSTIPKVASTTVEVTSLPPTTSSVPAMPTTVVTTSTANMDTILSTSQADATTMLVEETTIVSEEGTTEEVISPWFPLPAATTPIETTTIISDEGTTERVQSPWFPQPATTTIETITTISEEGTTEPVPSPWFPLPAATTPIETATSSSIAPSTNEDTGEVITPFDTTEVTTLPTLSPFQPEATTDIMSSTISSIESLDSTLLPQNPTAADSTTIMITETEDITEYLALSSTVKTTTVTASKLDSSTAPNTVEETSSVTSEAPSTTPESVVEIGSSTVITTSTSLAGTAPTTLASVVDVTTEAAPTNRMTSTITTLSATPTPRSTHSLLYTTTTVPTTTAAVKTVTFTNPTPTVRSSQSTAEPAETTTISSPTTIAGAPETTISVITTEKRLDETIRSSSEAPKITTAPVEATERVAVTSKTTTTYLNQESTLAHKTPTATSTTITTEKVSPVQITTESRNSLPQLASTASIPLKNSTVKPDTSSQPARIPITTVASMTSGAMEMSRTPTAPIVSNDISTNVPARGGDTVTENVASAKSATDTVPIITEGLQSMSVEPERQINTTQNPTREPILTEAPVEPTEINSATEAQEVRPQLSTNPSTFPPPFLTQSTSEAENIAPEEIAPTTTSPLIVTTTEKLNYTVADIDLRIEDLSSEELLYYENLVQGLKDRGIDVENSNSLSLLTQVNGAIMDVMKDLEASEMENLTPSLMKVLKSCVINSKECDISEDFKTVRDSTYGTCHTFHHQLKPKYFMTHTGSKFGLKMKLYVDLNEYLFPSVRSGVRVVLHPPELHPFPEVQGYFAPVGSSMSLGISYVSRNTFGWPKEDGVKLSPEVLGEFRIDRIQRAEADGKAIVFSLENYGHIQTILKQKKKLQDYECPWPLPNLPVHQKPRVSIVADLTRENMALRTECLKVLEKMTQDGKSAKIVGFRKISLNNAKPADYRSFKQYRP